MFSEKFLYKSSVEFVVKPVISERLAHRNFLHSTVLAILWACRERKEYREGI
jgi:hypothetical protein